VFLDQSFLFLPGKEGGFDGLTRVGDSDRMGLGPFREGEVDGVLRNDQIMHLISFRKTSSTQERVLLTISSSASLCRAFDSPTALVKIAS